MENLYAVILGLVEGITEFLPISSTGHLILADHLLGFENLVGKEVSHAFEIVIQLGAILAIVAAYPGRFAGLLDFRSRGGFAGWRGIGLLVITSIPAGLLGLALDKFIEKHLRGDASVAAALAAGAVWILVVEYLLRPRPRTAGVDALTWRDALSIGLFQCLSLWPGMSRSAATILGGMLSGIERKTATEYSFFAAVPIMIAASGYKFIKCYQHLSAGQLAMFAIGFIVAFFSAWAAVKVFVHFLTRHTLIPFGWYRLAVAAIVAATLLR